jgi:hypothetical protein
MQYFVLQTIPKKQITLCIRPMVYSLAITKGLRVNYECAFCIRYLGGRWVRQPPESILTHDDYAICTLGLRFMGATPKIMVQDNLN